MTDNTEIPTADKLAMIVGGGLVLFGVTVMGTLETLLGSAHSMPKTNEAGEVVAHTSFAPNLRATIIALGLLVFLVFALYKLGMAITEGGPEVEPAGEPAGGD